jgi:hypothetical protein
MEICCPQCKSDNVMTVPMAYESGTTTGKVSMLSFGLDSGVIGSRGKVTSQSVLAQRLKPPVEKKYNDKFFMALCVAIIFGVLASVVVGSVFRPIGILSGLLAGIGLVVYLFRKINKQAVKDDAEYLTARKQWLNSWVCGKCGSCWTY